MKTRPTESRIGNASARLGVIDRMWHALGCQLRNPTGTVGSIVGWLMALVNDEPNRLAIDALDLGPGERVLELGFGPGWSLRTIAACTRGARVYGVDQSARMLEQARRMNEVAVSSGRMVLLQGPFSPLPWIDDMFDKVLLANVVYFFDSDGRDISEVYRVLRPGGRVVIYVTSRDSMQKWPFAGPDTHRTFDAFDLADLLQSAGFRLRDIKITNAELALGVKGLIAVAEKSTGATRRDKIARGRAGLLCTAFVALMLVPAVATAEPLVTLPAPPFELPVLPPVSGTWTVMVGAEGASTPDFEGAKRSMLSPVPIFSIRRAGSTDQFRGPRDSPSIALIDFGDLRAGPVGKFEAARKQYNYSELNGLGDVKAAVELGGFVEYFPVDWFRTRVELRQGVIGHNGTVADFSADVIVPVIQRFTVSAGPRFTWESTQATSPYFGIDAVQAMASGLPVFNAKGGAHSYGAGAQVSYRINPQWEVHSYVEYQRLLGDAAASPLVTLRGSPNQTTVGMGASYAFDVKIR